MFEKYKETKAFILIAGIFAGVYLLPVHSANFLNGLHEAIFNAQEYAVLHILMIFVPALFITGAVSVFIKRDSIINFLGAKANRFLAYVVAALSGTVLVVSSGAILPLFSKILKRGSGLGPAITFLYSGPAISALTIIMTIRILGWQLGIARTVGAITFSIVIGVIMHFLFWKEEKQHLVDIPKETSGKTGRPIWQTLIIFALMIAIPLVLKWVRPDMATSPHLFIRMYQHKWLAAGIIAMLLGLYLTLFYGLRLWKVILTAGVVWGISYVRPSQPLTAYLVALYFVCVWLIQEKGVLHDWLISTWGFAKLIFPLLFISVLISGALFGRSGQEAWIPSEWITALVGGNSIWANLLASVSGAFMYFATLTEVPILNGLISSGMGKGPALALLLAGPAFSLPGIWVINSFLGTKKTLVYVFLVIVFSSITGYIFGLLFT